MKNKEGQNRYVQYFFERPELSPKVSIVYLDGTFFDNCSHCDTSKGIEIVRKKDEGEPNITIFLCDDHAINFSKKLTAMKVENMINQDEEQVHA